MFSGKFHKFNKISRVEDFQPAKLLKMTTEIEFSVINMIDILEQTIK